MNGDLARAADSRPARALKGGRTKWSLRAICIAAYLAISLPALTALCFVTGPFQVPDESTHFLRAVQLSHGQVLPVVTPDRKWAGGFVDRSAELLAWTLDFNKSTAPGRPHFTVAEVAKAGSEKTPGPLVYAPFNNTVIYFPIAHALPALVINVARQLNAPPLAWFYAGRLANALAALVICAFAIFLFEESSFFALVLCTLPMVLFEQASLSSDALVLAFSVLFAALLARIARGNRLTAWDYGALALTLAYVSVAKFAYLPLALAPPMVALIQKRDRTVVMRLAGIGLVAIGLWAAWSFTIRDGVVSGRFDRANVDVHRQLVYVLHHPLSFAAAFGRTLLMENIHPIAEMVGSKLGALDLHMPRLLSWLSMANLILVSVFRPAISAMRPPSRLVIAVLALGSLGATFFLLYLQFNPVGQPAIEGFQGRYILPVLALLPLIAGSWEPPARRMDRFILAVPLMSATGALVTVAVVAHAYWR